MPTRATPYQHVATARPPGPARAAYEHHVTRHVVQDLDCHLMLVWSEARTAYSQAMGIVSRRDNTLEAHDDEAGALLVWASESPLRR